MVDSNRATALACEARVAEFSRVLIATSNARGDQTINPWGSARPALFLDGPVQPHSGPPSSLTSDGLRQVGGVEHRAVLAGGPARVRVALAPNGCS